MDTVTPKGWNLSAAWDPEKNPLKPLVNHVNIIPRGLRGALFGH